jgi:hypothetical protein
MSTATLGRNGKAANRISALENVQTPEKPVKRETVTISPPNMREIALKIKGTAPFLQCAFPAKAMAQIIATQTAGPQNGKRAKREPRDFEGDFEGSIHRISKDVYGIPAAAFRAAAISACRLVGFKMTIAKLSVFILADGYDMIDGTALVKINGTPEKHTMMGRNADGGVNVRIRAIYKEWSATVRVKFDEDQFKLVDVVNLFSRIGQQIGIGEGRPDSKNSAGMGLGTFALEIEK